MIKKISVLPDVSIIRFTDHFQKKKTRMINFDFPNLERLGKANAIFEWWMKKVNMQQKEDLLFQVLFLILKKWILF